jgi:DNA-binding response OmpR family regulator
LSKITKKRKKILIIDDEPDMAEALAMRLEGAHFEALKAYSGKEGLDKFFEGMESKDQMNLILLDVKMPDMSGLNVLTEIRVYEEKQGIIPGNGVPIIMITGHKEVYMDAFNRGCNDFMVKPINENELMNKVQTKLGVKT